MPRHFDPLAAARSVDDRQRLGISDAEIIELAAAFRRFGFWRFDLESGLFFASEEIFTIFDMEYSTRPMNLVEVTSKIHEEDLSGLMETFERASSQGVGYHNIYRVKTDGDYKFVHSVAKFRLKPNGAGEIVGITYEFLDRWQSVAYTDD